MMSMIPAAAAGLPNNRPPQVVQKPRCTMLPLSPVTSIVFYLPVDANCTGRDKQRWSIGAPRRPLAITAMAIPHCDWISRTFIAYAAADTTAGKTVAIRLLFIIESEPALSLKLHDTAMKHIDQGVWTAFLTALRRPHIVAPR